MQIKKRHEANVQVFVMRIRLSLGVTVAERVQQRLQVLETIIQKRLLPIQLQVLLVVLTGK